MTVDALVALTDLQLGLLTRDAGIVEPSTALAKILLSETSAPELEDDHLLMLLDKWAPRFWADSGHTRWIRLQAGLLENLGAKMRRLLAPSCPHNSDALGPCGFCDETCHHHASKVLPP